MEQTQKPKKACKTSYFLNGVRGLSLIEVVLSIAILGSVVLVVAGAMGNMGVSVNYTRETTVSTSLAQEKLEQIKAGGFYNVVVTSVSALDNNFSPILEYDIGHYVPETIKRGGTVYTRRVFVEKLDDDAFGNLINMGYPHPDTGLKRVTVHVVWQKNGDWKKSLFSSLVQNPERQPLSKRVYGYVTDSITGDPVGGAVVAARRNPGWTSTTDSSGYYSFQCTGADMKLRSSKLGYDLYTSVAFTLPSYPNHEVQHDISFVAISSQTVEGYATRNTQLVISQVNAEWNEFDTDPWHDLEYVEIYNPTENIMNVSTANFALSFVTPTNDVHFATLTFVSTSIPPFSYFLIVGSTDATNVQTPNGVLADATYVIPGDPLVTPYHIPNQTEGGIILANSTNPLAMGYQVFDSVGWGDVGTANAPPPAAALGTGIDMPLANGGNTDLGDGEIIFRKGLSSSTTSDMVASGLHETYGNAWNSWDNHYDFVATNQGAFAANPRNTSTSYVPRGGTVWPGALVMADDPVSPMVLASTFPAGPDNKLGYYNFLVAEGTWTLRMSSSGWAGSKAIDVHSFGAPFLETVVATFAANVGYISGTVWKFSSSIFTIPILVQADPGGFQTNSIPGSGYYIMEVPAGETYIMTGNAGFDNPDWNTATSTFQITVDPGILYEGVDLSIWKNGYISGRVTTNGIDGIPDIVVVSTGQFSNGNTAVTDSNGNYVIPGLRMIGRPYWVYPVIEIDQTASPTGYSVGSGQGLTQGQTAQNIDFQINGAYMPISGNVFENAEVIDTGVLVMASTGPINVLNPPDINYALRTGNQYYYQTFSQPEGSYYLEVPGGKTYNVVAWYTDKNKNTTSKTGTIAVPASSGVNQDFNWP